MCSIPGCWRALCALPNNDQNSKGTRETVWENRTESTTDIKNSNRNNRTINSLWIFSKFSWVCNEYIFPRTFYWLRRFVYLVLNARDCEIKKNDDDACVRRCILYTFYYRIHSIHLKNPHPLHSHQQWNYDKTTIFPSHFDAFALVPVTPVSSSSTRLLSICKYNRASSIRSIKSIPSSWHNQKQQQKGKNEARKYW